MLPSTVRFLTAAYNGATITSGRSPLDLFADRLFVSSCEPTLRLAIERLLHTMQVSMDAVHPLVAAKMIAIANSDAGAKVLRWWRKEPKLVTYLAAAKDEAVVAEALAETVLPDADTDGVALSRAPFDIPLRVLLESPLSHGADVKAGNVTLFRTCQILTDKGQSAEVPFYAGNALRGQMRDLLFVDMLRKLDIRATKHQPGPLALWFYYLGFSGGALEEGGDASKALKKAIGDHGAIKVSGTLEFRQMLPMISLFGGATGNRLLLGHWYTNDLHPICREWGTGERSWYDLLSWEYLTRREDWEDHLANHSMITQTQVLRAGVELEGGIDYQPGIPPIELAALARGVELLACHGKETDEAGNFIPIEQRRAHLGAAANRGFGRALLTYERLPDSAPYERFLAENRTRILDYLKAIGALVEPQLATAA